MTMYISPVEAGLSPPVKSMDWLREHDGYRERLVQSLTTGPLLVRVFEHDTDKLQLPYTYLLRRCPRRSLC